MAHSQGLNLAWPIEHPHESTSPFPRSAGGIPLPSPPIAHVIMYMRVIMYIMYMRALPLPPP